MVAGKKRCDGAHLFVAGCHQECRRASVALDADCEISGFWMRELVVAVRRDRSTGMEIGIDHRAERAWAFKPGVEIKTELARQRKVGALPGCNDDAIGSGKRDRSRRSMPR